jgi:hypothetical protein
VWNHSAIYKPWEVNKCGIAINGVIASGNLVFTMCDMSHMYNEFSKFGDYNNWELYIEIAARSGGVCIDDLWTGIDTVRLGNEARDGFSVGYAVGHLTSLFLDITL